MRTKRPLILVALLWAASAGAQTAPPPDPLAPVRSMGRPPVWKPFVGGYYGLDQSEEQARSGGAAFAGLYKDLLPSIVGVGASAEAYLGGYSGVSGVDGGVRALAELRGLFLKAGVDYDFQREDASFILSLTVPLRRGGVLGYGTHLRVDWLPGRGNSWNFGLQVPLEPHMGKTRPRDTEVEMPRASKPRPRAPIDPAVVAAMQEVRTSARGIAVLSTAFWSDDRSDRREVPGADAAADPGIQEAHRPDEPRSPEGREHGERGPHPPRPARPRLRARHRRGRGGGEGARRSGRGGGARGRARRGALSVQPPLRAVQATGRALGSRREGASAFRGEARRRGPCRRAPRRHPRRLRGLPEGPRRDAGVVAEAARGRLAARLAPVPAGAPGRAARHPGGDRRDRLPRPGDASRRRQHRALLGRPAVPGRAAADDPRGRGLPRSLAPRLRRRRRGRQPRRGRLLHQRRGLPGGAHAAGARVRPDREAARLHDPGRSQLLGGQPGPPLHRRAAGPARRPCAAVAPGGPGEPQAAGGDRPGAAGAARGGGRVEAAAGGGGPARAGLAAEVRRRPPRRDEPRGRLLPHESPDRIPADRSRQHGARPPQDRLLRPDRARPREGGGAFRRGRGRGAVRDRHLGGPRGPPQGPRGPDPEGRGAALPEGERLHGRKHPSSAAAAA